jgi:hypothetical protein
LHSDHGFAQAPYEEITEEQFNDLVSKTKIISSLTGNIDYESNDECASGICPIK